MGAPKQNLSTLSKFYSSISFPWVDVKKKKKSFPGINQPGHEADHLPLSSAKVKKAWSYTSTPPICT